jgi:CubicO group peptidase (beta-lactamase class C family)
VPKLLLALLLVASARAQFASYDRLMADLMERYQLPGGAVAVSHNGKLVFSQGYGVPADALFRIASISKPFTAVAILKLVEQGKLRLDDKAFVDPAPDPRLNAITIRQILHHTAGWDRDASFDPMFRGLGAPPEIIRYMLRQKLDFDPGTKFAYSNFGFCVLGRIIERVSGLSYEEFVKREVLTPAGITRMKIGRSAASDKAAGEVTYYARGPASPYGGFNLEAMDSHGGWIASAPDLLNFVNAIDGRRGKPLLTKASIAELTSRPEPPLPQDKAVWYGLGFNIRPAGRDANWWHSGSLPGTTTLLVRTHHGYAWAALFNARPAGENKLAQELDAGLWKAFNQVNWMVQQ